MSNDSERADSTNASDETVNKEETTDESTNDSEVVSDEGTEGESKEEETVESLKEKLRTANFQKEHWREKATNKDVDNQPKPKETAKPSKLKELSDTDIIAVLKADIDQEDIEEVKDFAAYKKIPVSEALKNSGLKNILAARKEERATAAATNTSSSRRSASKISDDTLLGRAQKGEMPDSDDEIQRLVKARIQSKKQK